jgi:hypothetical protein
VTANVTANREQLEVQVIYRADNWVDAQLVRGWLQQQGLQVFLSGEYLSGAVGELPAGDLLSIRVHDHQVEQGLRLLAELREIRGEVQDDDEGDLLA